MQILRYPSINEAQYAGCVWAFVDSLGGELNTASIHLKRLEGTAKGEAFAFEMALDRGRYGALVVLDRWRRLNAEFGPHLAGDGALGQVIEQAERRVTAGETILTRANELLDAADGYRPEIVEAALLAFQQVNRLFHQEQCLAEQAGKLGPLVPEDQKAARAVFLADLAQR